MLFFLYCHLLAKEEIKDVSYIIGENQFNNY